MNLNNLTTEQLNERLKQIEQREQQIKAEIEALKKLQKVIKANNN